MDGFVQKEKYTLSDVAPIITLLRDPVNGCPWDKEQTHHSIRQNFIEELYEAIEAIDREDSELLEEELGDMIMQVALHAEMEREVGGFDLDDVADRLCKKLILRHPHIFGNVVAESSEKVLSNWEDIKRVEKNQKSGTDAINDVPKALPPLMRSQKVQKRAAYVGFDYPDIEWAMKDLCSEVDELKEALKTNRGVDEELGDLIFSAVNVARLNGIDAALACDMACAKFIGRFAKVEQLATELNIDMKTCGIDVLNDLWSRAKKSVG